jgi:hypothetical protein
VIDAEPGVGEERRGHEEEHRRGGPWPAGGQQHQRQEQRGDARVIGVALLEAQRTRGQAADVLEAQRCQDHGDGCQQRQRAHPVGG